jgi:hypothetical protein
VFSPEEVKVVQTSEFPIDLSGNKCQGLAECVPTVRVRVDANYARLTYTLGLIADRQYEIADKSIFQRRLRGIWRNVVA